MLYLKEHTFFDQGLHIQKTLRHMTEYDKKTRFFVTSHYPCYTYHKALQGDYPSYIIKRGGGITFHHEEQWICYIFSYLSSKNTITDLVHNLLDVVKNCLENFFHETFTIKEGLWIRNKKILSIGLAIENRVTYHGLALNLFLDPALIKTIEPCSLSPDQYASLSDFFLFSTLEIKKLLNLALKNSYNRFC